MNNLSIHAKGKQDLLSQLFVAYRQRKKVINTNAELSVREKKHALDSLKTAYTSSKKEADTSLF